MRILIFALIISFFIGGYSTSSYALGDIGCISQEASKQSNQDNCASHKTDNTASEKETGNKKPAACQDCAHHGCGSHTFLGNNVSYSVNIESKIHRQDTLAKTQSPSEYILSLLRPPQSLV